LKPSVSHAIVHILDDLEGGDDAGDFGQRFQAVILPIMAIDYLENILVSMVSVSHITERIGATLAA
jgi:hypothetical protein